MSAQKHLLNTTRVVSKSDKGELTRENLTLISRSNLYFLTSQPRHSPPKNQNIGHSRCGGRLRIV